MAPELRVMTSDFVFVAILDTYESLQWSRKLYEVGDVELHIHAGSPAADALQTGHIVFVDESMAAVLQCVEKTESRDGIEIVAKGVQLKGISQRRVTVPGQKQDQTFYGYDRYPDLDADDAPAESVLLHYAETHLVSPEDSNRAIPHLMLAADQQRGPVLRWQSRFESLDKVFSEIGEYSGMGYDISLDLARERYIFNVLWGADHTATSEQPVVFSPIMENLSSSKYTVDDKPWLNTAYAGGAGEDEARLIQTVFDGEAAPTGFNRRETWVDCGSIDDVNDLIYEARYKVREKKRTESLTGELVPSGPFLYGRDWNLGDLVTIRNEHLGVSLDLRITEIKYVYEPGKEQITPVFGSRTKNLLDEVRKTEVVR